MESKKNSLSNIAGDYFDQFLRSVSSITVTGNQAYTEKGELIGEKIAGHLNLLLPECTISALSIEFKSSEQGGELHNNDDINVFMQCIDAEFQDGCIIEL